MAIYAYEVIESGRRRSGVLQASGKADAAQTLRLRNAVVLSLRELDGMASTGDLPPRSRFERFLTGPFTRPIRREVALFQLSTLLQANVPLASALPVVSRLAPPLLARALLECTAQIREGYSFARSAREQLPFLGPVSLGLIEVGESNGRLEQTCGHAAELIKRNRLLRTHILRALIYPACVFVMALGTAYYAAAYAIPKMLERLRLLEDSALSVKMPQAFNMLEAAYLYTMMYGPYVALGAGLLLLLFLLSRCVDQTARISDRWVLRLPLLGMLLTQAQNQLWSRSLGLMLACGTDILSAFHLLERVANNRHFKVQFRRVQEFVSGGQSLSSSLAGTDLSRLSPMTTAMVTVGEDTGELNENLIVAANYCTEDLQRRVDFLVELVQPVMMLTVGVLVFFTLYAFYAATWAAYLSFLGSHA